MKHFKQLVKELPAKKIVFAFGRFQPPTTGHLLVVAAVKHVAEKQGADHVIYASRSQDKKSNPLPVDRKVYYLKRMFPGTNFVAANENVRTFIEAIKELNKKYKNLVMIAGSDRVPEYKKLLDKYNGKEFNYDTIEVVSAGERDPDADNASGMSGTKMRDAAKKGDFNAFKKGLPSTLTTQDAKRLMNEIREGMGIESLKEQVVLERSDLREKYHAGEIYNIGDIVESADVVYQIKKRGSNHLLLQDQDGNLVNKWITDVTESVKEFNLQQGLLEMKFTSADKIKVARIIANTLGVADVEKKGSAEQLVNDGLRKVRNKPMRPEYIDVLHKMLATAKEAGIEYDEKLVPQKAQVDEGIKPTFNLPNSDRTDKKGVAYNPHRKEKTADDLKRIAAAKKSDDKREGSGLYKKQSPAQRKNLVKSYMDMLKDIGEGVNQPNGTTKVGGIIAELSPETLKSYIPKAMGSKSAADFTRGVKMAQGTGGEEELRKKSEKRSAGIHTAIKKLTKEDLEEANFASTMKKAIDAHDRGDHARAKYHLDNAKTARYAMKSTEISKHKDLLDKYKELRDMHEEVELEEGKMGELHDTISRHLDKHISDFKSGHTGMDQFGSKVLAAHKSVAKEHGLEHKHAAKFVNDYVDSKLNEEAITEWVVKHDGVPADHPDYAIKRQFHGKKDVINHLTKYKDSAEQRAEFLKKKGYQNVRIEEGKDYSVTVTHYADGKHTKHDYTVKNANDYKHAKHIAMQRHGKKIGTLKQGEQYGASNMDVKELNKESYNEISDLLEQIATAAMMGKNTETLKKKLSQLRHDPKNNESDVEAQATGAEPETKIGHSVTSPVETDTVRKMKIRQMSEETLDEAQWIKKTVNGVTHYFDKLTGKRKSDIEEDQATAEYKIKKFVGPDGKTHERKIRPHIINFKNSKKGGEPEVDEPGEGLKKETFDPFFNDGTQDYITDDDLKKKKLVQKEEHDEEHEDISDAELDRMADSVTDLDDIIDAYDDDELHIVDDDGEHIEDLKEEVINEVLSRMERIRARIKFAQSKSKRERKAQIALRSASSVSKINQRARRLAVKLIKARLVKKPLSKMSIGEKERAEKFIEKRKALVNRLAMKLTSRVKKIEQQRLQHKK